MLEIAPRQNNQSLKQYVFATLSQNIVRLNLKPGEKPEGVFPLGDYKGKVHVYEYCNLHGLWKKEL